MQLSWINCLHFLLLHSSRNFHWNLLHFDLYLANGKQKFINPGKDFHKIRSEDEINRPTHFQVERKIAPNISIMIIWLRNHLPLLDFCLAIKIVYIGNKANVGSIHLQSKIIRQLYFINFCSILLILLIRVYWIYR